MAIAPCPQCTTINNSDRNICRVCGTLLKAEEMTERGRLTFDTNNTTEEEGYCSIPVKVDGNQINVRVSVTLTMSSFTPTEQELTQYRDARAVVMGALRSRHRTRERV